MQCPRRPAGQNQQGSNRSCKGASHRPASGREGASAATHRTISLTHVDAHSNLLDRDAMGGFFVVQQQHQEQHQERQQQDDHGDESDGGQEPFATRARHLSTAGAPSPPEHDEEALA